MNAPQAAPVHSRENVPALRAAVERIVAATPVTDIHTHLYAPVFGDLLLYGIDELLTYHYLIAEVLRVAPVSPAAFYAMDKPAQADLIWRELFLERAPISEACRGVLTALGRLGLDTSVRDLAAYRDHFAHCDLGVHIDHVFERAGMTQCIMTNDPFDASERPVWEAQADRDPRFLAALRIDPLLNDYANASKTLRALGYDAAADLDAASAAEVRRFLTDWAAKIDARYMAVSLPPEFAYGDGSLRSRVLDECVLPAARDRGIPFAMMIGVTRQVNPALRLAGDSVGPAGVAAVERICAANPDNRFLCTMLAREDQHALCVTARKFPNLLIFGCWWFLNNPSLIEEMTRMRIELLGLSIVPQHSDARVLEQVIYKWEHSRAVIAKVLADKFADLANTGWTVSEAEIQRDAARLLGGTFWDFVAK